MAMTLTLTLCALLKPPDSFDKNSHFYPIEYLNQVVCLCYSLTSVFSIVSSDSPKSHHNTNKQTNKPIEVIVEQQLLCTAMQNYLFEV